MGKTWGVRGNGAPDKLEIIGPPGPTHVTSGTVLRSRSIEATYNKEPVSGKETRCGNGFAEYECLDSQM